MIRGLDALFVFVACPEVEPTNNRSERNVCHEAMVRKGGRTSNGKSSAAICLFIVGSIVHRLRCLYSHFRLLENRHLPFVLYYECLQLCRTVTERRLLDFRFLLPNLQPKVV